METTETTLQTSGWTDLGATPCLLQVRRGSVRVVIDSVAPTDLKAPHLVLSDREPSANIVLTGQNVFARCGDADGQTARIAVVR